MILSAFLLLCCAVATWTVSPAKGRQSQIESPSSEDHLAYGTLDQVKADLQRVGLESSNLIIGVDFTRSNEWTGKRCFGGRSLHHLGAVPNPYEEAISIVGETLSAYDEDNDIPCFGFGDTASVHARPGRVQLLRGRAAVRRHPGGPAALPGDHRHRSALRADISGADHRGCNGGSPTLRASVPHPADNR
uniref:Copine C-terminal domain-containing protein n=1 Tax=Triticum urartu TaxID=4572 RepID=A0A8R7QHY5_TRIUA